MVGKEKEGYDDRSWPPIQRRDRATGGKERRKEKGKKRRISRKKTGTEKKTGIRKKNTK